MYVSVSDLLDFLQQCDNICSQFAQFLFRLSEFSLCAVALFLHGPCSRLRTALVGVTQLLQPCLILLKILFLQHIHG